LRIQGIEKKPLLLNLLKKIELKPFDKSGQYTQRVADLKIKADMTGDYKFLKGFNYHRTKKNSSVKKVYSDGTYNKTVDRRKTKSIKTNKELHNKREKRNHKVREDKSTNSKKVDFSIYS
jgi:hypothetical protein